jgi:hypothetical protein
MKDYQPHYTFSHSLITGNTHYMGLNGKMAIEEDPHYLPVEIDVRKSGKVILNDVKDGVVPKDYLHLSPVSDGKDLHAGVLKGS